jgi:transcription-repair coupling factor (superfamily II helicase)
LEQAIRELKGEEVRERVTPEIHLPVEAIIPPDYIAHDNQRLILYKRLAVLQEEGEVEKIKGELQDRFGPVPLSLLNLLEVIRLKIWLSRFSVKRFELRDKRAVLAFASEGVISAEKVVKLIEQGGGRYRLTQDMRLIFTPEARDWQGVLTETKAILQGLV